MKIASKIFLALLMIGPLATAAVQPADLILTNARIYTVEKTHPWAEALAVRGDRIVAIGTVKQMKAYRGPSTRIMDAQQHLVLPGFIDSHIHFMDGSLSLMRVNVEDTKDLAGIQKMVKEFADAHPDAPWVLGRGWSYAEFGNRTLPDKKDLDAIVPDRPVFLEGYDGHTYWANSKALQLAGINKDTPNPPNGEIVRDPATGEPTGALKEDAAAALFDKVIPKPTDAERLEALRRGIAFANQNGLTRVVSCGGDFEVLTYYDQLRRAGQLTLRMDAARIIDLAESTAKAIDEIKSAEKSHHDEWLAAGYAKFFLDGVVESHTAAMLAPYADDPSLKGKLFWDPEKYKQAVQQLESDHIQVFTHAIGDGAVRLALDAYESANAINKTPDARERIEHIETITAEDIPRFGKLGVIASFQPLHAYPDSDTLDVWLKNAGHQREPRAWAWQSIAKTGGHEAFGSDWPVVTLNPWQGVQTALTRQSREGTPPGGWVPEQRLSLEQAIAGYTLGAAYAIHRENEEGSLKLGKLADFIVLSQDLFKIDPHQVSDTKVLLTVVGGKSVYESPAWLKMQSAAAKAGGK